MYICATLVFGWECVYNTVLEIGFESDQQKLLDKTMFDCGFCREKKSHDQHCSTYLLLEVTH